MRGDRANDSEGGPGPHDDVPELKTYRLHPSKVDAARDALGTRTETETIELALDLVVFAELLASDTEGMEDGSWSDPLHEEDPWLEADG